MPSDRSYRVAYAIWFGGIERNEEEADSVVARLNAAPLDWPNRYNGRRRTARRIAGAK